MLWRVLLYFRPGLPSPTIIFKNCLPRSKLYHIVLYYWHYKHELKNENTIINEAKKDESKT
jgi:hypothetical protein